MRNQILLLWHYSSFFLIAASVNESYLTKKRDKKAALKFMKKAMRRYGSPNEIVTDRLRSYTAAAKELGCADKQVTGRWANNRVENSHLPFRRQERAMLRFGACIVCRSLPQSMHRFISCSTNKGHSQNAVLSSLTVMPLLPSGALLLSNRTLALQASDAWADLSDGTAITSSLFLFLVFLALFLRKIRDLQQRFLTDAAHHLSYQR